MNAGQQPAPRPAAAQPETAAPQDDPQSEHTRPVPRKHVPVISAAKPPPPEPPEALPQGETTAFPPALGAPGWTGQADGEATAKFRTNAAVSAASANTAVARGIAAPLPPAGGPGGSLDEDPTVVVRKPQDWRRRKRRSVPRLMIGRHDATDQGLDLLQMADTSFGFPLGRNQAGFPVSVPLFRPEPVSVALVGASWAARLLAYRALRSGAKVLVFTDRPAGWADLGRAATGRGDRVAVLEPGAPAGVVASADAPVLSLFDAEAPPSPAEAAPWQTRVMVLHRLTPDHTATALAANIVLLQRLTPQEAGLITSARGFAPQAAEQLRTLRNDMLAVLTTPENHFVWLTPTAAEFEELGPAGRY